MYYIPVSHYTITKKGVESVSSFDKKCITGTFAITLEGDFLPLQLDYHDKTKQSLPKYKFPETFLLSVNPKHFSNTKESIKIIEEILLPYVDMEREKLNDPSQAALLVLDVFSVLGTNDIRSN